MTSILALLGLTSLALAQDNAAAGLFTDARQLPLVSQSIAVTVEGDEARLHLTQVFVNDGPALGQADYALHLPQGATVEAFGFWNHDRYLEAELQAREDAHAAHAQAAAEGRSTALMDQEGPRHSFSVFPVEAGSTKQVELTLSLPVEVEGGRRELRLPVDHFLGQGGATSTVTVRIDSEHPLADLGLAASSTFGADGTGAETVVLERDAQHALLATTAWQSLVLHWQEEAPALDLVARRVETPDGQGLALRIGLNEVLGEVGWQRLVVFRDDSLSMQRRSATVEAAIDRVIERSPVPAEVIGFGDRVATIDPLLPQLDAEDCGTTTRCLVLTDAQLPGIAGMEGQAAELIVLADAHERAYFADQLPPRAAVYQPGIEPLARLLAQLDEAVLPVLQLDGLALDGTPVQPLTPGPWRVAEGGLLRLHAFAPDATLASAGLPPASVLELTGTLAGAPFQQRLVVEPAGDAAERLRRNLYRDQLAAWMRGWKSQPDEELKARITEVSLREGIPTAFTSLQVDDPELSLVAIKPGDPTLSVDAAPGVTDVVAWYPFGDMRRLVHEPGRFSDRFLVPRYWQERAYRVEVFERHADGSVVDKSAWYVLDEALPDAKLSMDEGRLLVDTGEATPDIGEVEVHVAGAAIPLQLHATAPAEQATTWTTEEALPEAFTVVVRDRAGNVLRLPATLVDGTLGLELDGERIATAPELPIDGPELEAAGDLTELSGHDVVVHLADRSLRFDRRGLELRSVLLTAALDTGEALYLGTRGGDLLRLDCDGSRCEATPIAADITEHPVTGIVEHDGDVVVGVLGEGLFTVQGESLARAPWRIGSRFVTGLAVGDEGDLVVGTGYDGLWRIVGGRAFKSRFPHDHVAGLLAPGDLLSAREVMELEVDSGHGRFERLARDRFQWQGPGLNHRDLGADDLVALQPVGDTVYVAGFDSGLWRLGPQGERSPVALHLSPDEQRLNALALHDGKLWLATEGGLLAVDPDRPETGVVRVLEGAAHDLAEGEGGLAVASSAGLFLVDGLGARRVDVEGPLDQPLVGTGRYISVAWHQGALWAGSLDGLVRFEEDPLPGVAPGFVGQRVSVEDGFGASWVTALESEGGTLWIGTYADGLWRADASGIVPEPALAQQWVPPGALSLIGSELWVGGIGMAPARLDPDTGDAVAVDLPVRDSNAFVGTVDGRVLVASSDGLVVVGGSEVAAR